MSTILHIALWLFIIGAVCGVAFVAYLAYLGMKAFHFAVSLFSHAADEVKKRY